MVGAERLRATSGGPRRGECLDCQAAMMAKTGNVMVWHWAHLVRPLDCQAAYETEWHLQWKSLALDGTQERPHPTGKRRADVLALGGFAVEFQHSALTAKDVQAREADWDNKLVWVFDAQKAYQKGSLKIMGQGGQRGLFWFKAPEQIKAARCPTFYDIGNDELLRVGELRQEKSSLKGRGWVVSKQSVVSGVLRGANLPSAPVWSTAPSFIKDANSEIVPMKLRNFLVDSVGGRNRAYLNVAGDDPRLEVVLCVLGWRADWISPNNWLLPSWSDHWLRATLARNLKELPWRLDFIFTRYPDFRWHRPLAENDFLYLARQVSNNPYLTLEQWNST
jgi:hypothetical protein